MGYPFQQIMNSRLRLPASLVNTLHALALALAATGVAAGEPRLDAVVRAVSHDLIAAIVQDRSNPTRGPEHLARLGEEMILPHVDGERMTRLAMGANWRRATPDQQRRLAQEFTMLLAHAYAAALASLIDRHLVTSRVRAETHDEEIAVRFEISQPDARSIAIDYAMGKGPSGWKIYDVKIRGVSLVTAYYPAFSEEVRNYGVEGLIGLLSSLNRQTNSQIAAVRL